MENFYEYITYVTGVFPKFYLNRAEMSKIRIQFENIENRELLKLCVCSKYHVVSSMYIFVSITNLTDIITILVSRYWR